MPRHYACNSCRKTVMYQQVRWANTVHGHLNGEPEFPTCPICRSRLMDNFATSTHPVSQDGEA